MGKLKDIEGRSMGATSTSKLSSFACVGTCVISSAFETSLK
jgi:hypothetical protein